MRRAAVDARGDVDIQQDSRESELPGLRACTCWRGTRKRSLASTAMPAVVATAPLLAMVYALPSRWLEAARALLGKTNNLMSALTTLCLWALRWRAKARTTSLSDPKLLAWPVRISTPTDACPGQSNEKVAPVDTSMLSVATIDLYDDEEALEEAIHGTPAPRAEVQEPIDPVVGTSVDKQVYTAVAPKLDVVIALETGSTDECALHEGEGTQAEELPTPSTARLLTRLRAPRRFKMASWQPQTRTRTVDAVAANQTQVGIDDQAQGQRVVAETVTQRQDESRTESESGSCRSGGQVLLEAQPNCEVYSASSRCWLAGTYVAADVLPNTVKVQYVSSKGSAMQKLLPLGSPHLRKVKPIHDGTPNSLVDRKDSAKGVPSERSCLGQVTNEQANIVPTPSRKPTRRGPRNGGGGYKKRYQARHTADQSKMTAI